MTVVDIKFKDMKQLNPASPVFQEYVCEPCLDKLRKINKNSLFIGGCKHVSCNYCGEKKDSMLTHYYAGKEAL